MTRIESVNVWSATKENVVIILFFYLILFIYFYLFIFFTSYPYNIYIYIYWNRFDLISENGDGLSTYEHIFLVYERDARKHCT